MQDDIWDTKFHMATRNAYEAAAVDWLFDELREEETLALAESREPNPDLVPAHPIPRARRAGYNPEEVDQFLDDVTRRWGGNPSRPREYGGHAREKPDNRPWWKRLFG